MSDEDWLVTVCDSCRCASCWQGEFYCDDYKIAGTIDVAVSQLRKEARENPHYWSQAMTSPAPKDVFVEPDFAVSIREAIREFWVCDVNRPSWFRDDQNERLVQRILAAGWQATPQPEGGRNDVLELIIKQQASQIAALEAALRDLLTTLHARPDIWRAIQPLMGFQEMGQLKQAYSLLSAKPDAGGGK